MHTLFYLATLSYRAGSVVLFRLELLPVVLNEIKLLSMAVAGIEVVLLHFSIRLVIVPVMVVEPINCGYHSRAMATARAVHALPQLDSRDPAAFVQRTDLSRRDRQPGGQIRRTG